jgi:hypothetical protein
MARLLGMVILVAALVAACSVGSPGGSASAPPASVPATGAPPASSVPSPTNAAGSVSTAEAAELFARCPPAAGHIHAYFRVPAGHDIHDYLPAAGKSPELDGVSALVVIYDDPVRPLWPITGVPGASRPPLSNVVCVVTPSGEFDLYSDVSRAGMTLPPGAHLGP